MTRKREIPGLNIALLDILTGALGAVIILFVTVPKAIKQAPPVENSRMPVSVPKKQVKASETIALTQGIKARDDVIKKLKQKIEQTQSESANKIKELQAELEKKKEVVEKPSFRGKGLPVDVGFDFKGKKIVFIIDISGSMQREDRIGQVKAGLKMLITSMPADYQLDVVVFPYADGYHHSLWGRMKNLDEFNKVNIYEYLLGLKAFGSTPTAKVLDYAFRTYPEATDFVLLSDGAPTKGNTRKPDNIAKILLDVKFKNRKNIRINTIGVGSAFLKHKDSSSYVFLHELARAHGGFFVGF